jgi:hypothetical protein
MWSFGIATGKLADGGRMKFNIEIVREDDSVVYRASVDEMSPSRARTKAGALLNLYAVRGARSARILNDKDEELYKL